MSGADFNDDDNKPNWTDLRPADSKRPITVKVCKRWAPPLSAKARENFDKIFGERKGGESERAPDEKALSVGKFRENFDAIFAKREQS